MVLLVLGVPLERSHRRSYKEDQPGDGRSDRLSLWGSYRLRCHRAFSLLNSVEWPILSLDSPAGVTFDSSDAPSL